MVSEVNFPTNTFLNGKESDSYYRDAFAVKSRRTNLGAKYVYHSVFAFLPNFIQSIIRILSRIVKIFGFSGFGCPVFFEYNAIYKGRKIGPLTFDKINGKELVVVADEKHMDIWVSVLKVTETKFIISTLINFKTKRGRIYMKIMKPFHQFLTKFSIKQAMKSRRI